MFFRLDEENNIKDCCEEKYADDCLFTSDIIERDFEGQLVFASDKQTSEYKAKLETFENEQEKQRLIYEREKECFMVVNRGKLWYDTLSEEQLKVLSKWYREWLDVTESRIKPPKPDFV